MPGHTPEPTPTTASTRREALDTPTRRARRALRRRATIVAGGAAVLAIAGGALTVGTQPAIGEALGLPSGSASASATTTPRPALSGTALDRAQAAATISTAQTVMRTANDKTDTSALARRVDALSDYRQLSGAALTTRISSTVASTAHVEQASATQDRRDVDAEAAAAAKATARARAAAEAEERVRALAAGNTVAGAKATATSLASSGYGWGADQFQCLDNLWTKESGWDYRAVNPNGGATGIPQALPGSKMATIAPDWQTNATTQITWGLRYISEAYGTPCAAWAHSQASNFY
ncbi:phospholipase [Curtobacterium sp. MCLR17_036]|uniref:aggregation-promoting factor C-terminal-like domain-containing protein n=1 Tax=Curtobacterium sp. MCLR17_036 TaxID=2175620 RepID=UPI0024DF6A3A|nr:phospholipase [Curtobacterium sp. MCLR17_036]WIE64051.1 phospholipase [Curtobacterium sp. MCLR17_036]